MERPSLPVTLEVLVKERLISEIRRLTQRIGQARRSGVTELAERLRLSRLTLATRLAREFDVWFLVNPEGKSEFVDREAFGRRMAAWKARRQIPAVGSADTPAADEPTPSPASSNDPMRELFGEPIHVYTRDQALADGVLVDVTPWAAGCFRHPTAFTSALWGIVSDLPCDVGAAGAAALDLRIREVLRAAATVASSSSKDRSRVTFPLLIGTTQGLRSIELVADCGPGDRGEPVITIGFPSDF